MRCTHACQPNTCAIRQTCGRLVFPEGEESLIQTNRDLWAVANGELRTQRRRGEQQDGGRGRHDNRGSRGGEGRGPGDPDGDPWHVVAYGHGGGLPGRGTGDGTRSR